MFTRDNQALMDPKQLKVSLMKPSQYYEKVKQSRKLIINHAKLNIQHRNKLSKIRYDQNRPDPKYDIGDLVLVRAIN